MAKTLKPVTTDMDTVRAITARLNESATLAEVLMTQIDDGDVSAEMKRRFSDVMLATQKGIASARQLDDAFQALQQRLQWEKSRLDLAMQRAKDRQHALKERIKEVVAANPAVIFKDGNGGKVYVQASNPALKFAFELGKKSVVNIAPVDFPAEYTEPVSFRVVNTQAVRDALNRGETLDFAWLEQGQSLRGL
jgi:hypothetical protein